MHAQAIGVFAPWNWLTYRFAGEGTTKRRRKTAERTRGSQIPGMIAVSCGSEFIRETVLHSAMLYRMHWPLANEFAPTGRASASTSFLLGVERLAVNTRAVRAHQVQINRNGNSGG